jgi:hypothetical protein
MSNQLSALQKSFLNDEILRSTLVPTGRGNTNILLRFIDGKNWEVVNYDEISDTFLFGINYATEEEAIKAYKEKITEYRANGQR